MKRLKELKALCQNNETRAKALDENPIKEVSLGNAHLYLDNNSNAFICVNQNLHRFDLDTFQINKSYENNIEIIFDAGIFLTMEIQEKQYNILHANYIKMLKKDKRVIFILDNETDSFQLVEDSILAFVKRYRDLYEVTTINLSEVESMNLSQFDNAIIVSDLQTLGQVNSDLKFELLKKIESQCHVSFVSTHSLFAHGNHIDNFYSTSRGSYDTHKPVYSNKKSKQLIDFFDGILDYSDQNIIDYGLEDFKESFIKGDIMSINVFDFARTRDNSSNKPIIGWIEDKIPEDYFIMELILHANTYIQYPEGDTEHYERSMYFNMIPELRRYIGNLPDVFSINTLKMSNIAESQLMTLFRLNYLDKTIDGSFKFKVAAKLAITKIIKQMDEEESEKEKAAEICRNNERLIERDLFPEFGKINFNVRYNTDNLDEGKDYFVHRYVDNHGTKIEVTLFFTETKRLDYYYDIL